MVIVRVSWRSYWSFSKSSHLESNQTRPIVSTFKKEFNESLVQGQANIKLRRSGSWCEFQSAVSIIIERPALLVNFFCMKGDSYSTGRHFWIHFWCGLVVGGGVGAWISCDLFESTYACFALGAGLALTFALCAGYWGDSFWYFFLEGL
jgi:hypothetical protein